MVMCTGAAEAARSVCGGSRWRLHSLRTSTRSFCTPPVSLVPSLSLSTTPAKVRATLYSSRPLRRMASPMRIRGGGAVELCCAAETGRASIAAAGVDGGAAAATGEDCTRLRFGARFLVALAADGAGFAPRGEDADAAAAEPDDFAAPVADDDSAAGAEDFGARADGLDDLAAGADFAAHVDDEDDDEDGDAAMVVASPKASASAALIAAGDARFERLRLLERVLLVRAADFVVASPAMAGDAAGADVFRFLGMGLCVVAAARRLEIAAGARCC